MDIQGIRAFGKNEGDLNHTGDFVLLFQPVIDYLYDVAVFGPDKLNTYDVYRNEDPGIAELLEEELDKELENLRLAENVKGRLIYPPYYGAGFFPKFAKYVEDDWNDLICFKAPYPEYEDILGKPGKETYEKLKERLKKLNFYVLFQNVDACFWNCYINDDALFKKLIGYLERKQIDYEMLDFDKDYPYSALKKPRTFKGIHPL